MSHTQTFEPAAKIGFYVSSIAYLAFWAMDLVRPGFVSRTISVHLFLAAAIIFGGWWLYYRPTPKFSGVFSFVFSVLFGVLLAVLVWGFGEGLGEHQLPCTVLSIFLPALLFRLIRVS